MPTFGRDLSSGFTPTSVSGQTGWWIVPSTWFMKRVLDCPSEVIASPNQDFSTPVYYCKLADDMQSFAFQDMLLGKITGQDSQYKSPQQV
jgi:hypothetical protein